MKIFNSAVSDGTAYETDTSGIYTAGIDMPFNAGSKSLSRNDNIWHSRIECHGESQAEAEELRDAVLAAIKPSTTNVAAREVVPTTGAMAVRRSSEPVTNIGQLLEALAVGWKEGARNRRLIAGIGGQFVRTPESGFSYPYYRPGDRDLLVDSGTYSMTGFIQHEAGSTFPGMFRTDAADDDAWRSAELTAHGYRIAKLGVLDFDHSAPAIKACPFFCPPLHNFAHRPQISQDRLAITDSGENA